MTNKSPNIMKSSTAKVWLQPKKIVQNFLPEKNDNVAEISDPTIWSVFLLQTVTGSKNEEAEIFFFDQPKFVFQWSEFKTTYRRSLTIFKCNNTNNTNTNTATNTNTTTAAATQQPFELIKCKRSAMYSSTFELIDCRIDRQKISWFLNTKNNKYAFQKVIDQLSSHNSKTGQHFSF